MQAKSTTLPRTALALAAAALLSGCSSFAVGTDEAADSGRRLPAATERLISSKDMERGSPILVRIYKEEDKLEVWKRDRTGRFAKLKDYDICKFSGALGPKRNEGDKQAPEGFYSVTRAQMNPKSRNHLAFNLGYPNAFDRSLGRTGHALMVHGGCTSVGCYAMTDESIDEIYTLASDAFAGGQPAFQVQALPFRMTTANLVRHRKDPNLPFWRNLKEGTDAFEVSLKEPSVATCTGRYAFGTGPLSKLAPTSACPAPSPTSMMARAADDAAIRLADAAPRSNIAVAEGTPVRTGAAPAAALSYAPSATRGRITDAFEAFSR